MAKPNYNFEKRQRELKKRQKQEEKLQKKAAARGATDVDDTQPADAADAIDDPANGPVTPGHEEIAR